MGRSMMRNDSLTWDDLRMLRSIWPRTLIVKGVLHPSDALEAAMGSLARSPEVLSSTLTRLDEWAARCRVELF